MEKNLQTKVRGEYVDGSTMLDYICDFIRQSMHISDMFLAGLWGFIHRQGSWNKVDFNLMLLLHTNTSWLIHEHWTMDEDLKPRNISNTSTPIRRMKSQMQSDIKFYEIRRDDFFLLWKSQKIENTCWVNVALPVNRFSTNTEFLQHI